MEPLDVLIARSPRARFAQGVAEAVVADAEAVLGVRFPPSYRQWLLRYGSGRLGSYELQGLFPDLPSQRDPAEAYPGDVVYTALLNRADGMPPHLLEILNYEGDEVYLLDVSSADGEARVLCREAGCDELRTSASSFAEFLRNELRS